MFCDRKRKYHFTYVYCEITFYTALESDKVVENIMLLRAVGERTKNERQQIF
jgi:hypothetical protein